MAGERKYCVVKYDIMSLESDPERPGRSRSYENRDIAAPRPMDGEYDTVEEATAEVDKLMAGPRGDEIDITLANGQQYKGPRYMYTIGEVSR
jgi:hypothetical protein